MSKENVEIVRAVIPPTGTDLTDFFSDSSETANRLAAAEPLFDPAFEFASHAGMGEWATGRGLQELGEAWREWMQAFETWRTELEEVIDVDDARVLVLIRDHVRPRGADSEIESLGCNLWTFRGRKIARVDFYPNRSLGLEAAGLSG